MTCTSCGQGLIFQARFRGEDQVFYVCDECEAVWYDANLSSNAGGSALYVEFERRGLPEDWGLLEVEQI